MDDFMEKHFEVGEKYGIDLEILWKLYAANPENPGEIGLTFNKRLRFTKDGNNKYYDLISNITDEILCMDGEVCEVLYSDKDIVELVEEDTQIRFNMTKYEFKAIQDNPWREANNE